MWVSRTLFGPIFEPPQWDTRSFSEESSVAGRFTGAFLLRIYNLHPHQQLAGWQRWERQPGPDVVWAQATLWFPAWVMPDWNGQAWPSDLQVCAGHLEDQPQWGTWTLPFNGKECSRVIAIRKNWGTFPGGPMVKNLSSNAGDTGSVAGWGTYLPHAVG